MDELFYSHKFQEKAENSVFFTLAAYGPDRIMAGAIEESALRLTAFWREFILANVCVALLEF